MTLVTITYIAALGLGVVWVIYRLVVYLRAERERESMISAQMFSDSRFEPYLSELKARNDGNESVGPEPEMKSADEEATPRG